MEKIFIICLIFFETILRSLALPTPGSYYTDESARRLIHFDIHTGDCNLFGDRRIVDEIIRELSSSDSPVAILEDAELTQMISDCSKQIPQSKDTPKAVNFPHVIYPGTKWCGTGNAAEDLEDLGRLKDLDICCRDHDLCPDDLEPGQTRHNISNDTPFTMSHCDCNDKFRSCLKKIRSKEANEIGSVYFSSGLFQCFKLEKPAIGCLQWTGLVTQACQEYSYDTNKEPRWQIFDMPTF